MTIGKALCDVGASINFMPFSNFHRLGIRAVNPTIISLQLADHSIRHPYGIVEDALVKVDKFIFLIDFIALDMDEDADVPLILGWPFLAIGKALIKVQQRELMLRVMKVVTKFKLKRNVSTILGSELRTSMALCSLANLRYAATYLR